jgi:hypothetical protein
MAKRTGYDENPMSDGSKLALGLAAIAAVGAIGYAVAGGSSKAATNTPGGGSGGGSGGSGGTTPTPSPTPTPTPSAGKWVPATTFTNGKRYRVSGDVRGALKAQGFTLYTDHDTPPSDWPSDDLGGGRWRIEGIWGLDSTDVPLEYQAQGVKVYEWKMNTIPGAWVAVTTLQQGKRYRASAPAPSILQQLGVTVWNESIPDDWPSTDRDPSRWRGEIEWNWPTQVLPAMFTSAPVNALVWEYQP